MTEYLPEALESTRIAGLLDGEVAYTLPWAMWAGADRKLWINANYPAKPQPGGTCEMQIVRSGEFIIVNLETLGGQTYQPGPSSWDDHDKFPVKLLNKQAFNEHVGGLWT